MGSTYSNVQVFVGEQDREQVVEAVVETLRQWILAKDYVEVPDANEVDEHFQRRIVLVGPVMVDGSTSWLGIYDRMIDGIHPPADLLNQLSDNIATTVLGITLGDSDALQLDLHGNGQHIDTFSNRPDYWSVAENIPPDPIVGHPEKWRGMFVDGATSDDLRKAWDENPVFLSDTLAKTAVLLDLDTAYCCTGFGYGYYEWKDDPAFIQLHFRSKEPVRTPVRGLPAFLPDSYTPYAQMAIGDSFRNLMASVQSMGGASQGLDIIVWGDVLQKNLIEVDAVTIAEQEYLFETTQQSDAHGIHLPDYAISAGVISRQGHPIWMTDNMIIARLSGRVVKEGEGQLHIAFVPHANPQEGVATQTIDFEITAAPKRRPLRVKPDIQSHELKKLEIPRRLLALVSLGADRHTCANVAREAIESWNTILNVTGEECYQIALRSDLRIRSKIEQLQAKAIPDGKRWQELRTSFTDYFEISGTIPSEIDETSFDYGSGFYLDTSGIGLRKSEKHIPHLGLWLDLESPTVGDHQVAAHTLVAIVDDVMTKANGLQAFVARWDWAPHQPISTAYERVCGIHTDANTEYWCTRYLRGVSAKLWLGPALVDRLEDRKSLEEIADVAPVGNGLRIELNEGIDLSVLESHLAPLLPSHDDWEFYQQYLFSKNRKENR